MSRLLIFANGSIPSIESAKALIKEHDIICAADGGTRNALNLGVMPSIVIGDLDSLRADEKQRIRVEECEIQEHPRNKDQTDLELALEYAIETGYDPIRVIGGLGGRLDQTLGNLTLLSAARFSNRDIRLDDGVEQAFFIRSQAEIHGNRGEIVSLIPWGGEVSGVSTQGLRWQLKGESLFPEKTRGISNEILAADVSISISTGLLLVIHSRQIQPT